MPGTPKRSAAWSRTGRPPGRTAAMDASSIILWEAGLRHVQACLPGGARRTVRRMTRGSGPGPGPGVGDAHPTVAQEAGTAVSAAVLRFGVPDGRADRPGA